MLNSLTAYLNSLGYYFYDSNYSYENHNDCFHDSSYWYGNYNNGYNYNYEYINNYNNHQPYSVHARRRSCRSSWYVPSNLNNQKRNAVKIGKRMALEDANIKERGTKVQGVKNIKNQTKEIIPNKANKMDKLVMEVKNDVATPKRKQNVKIKPKLDKETVVLTTQKTKKSYQEPKQVKEALLHNQLALPKADLQKSNPHNKFSVKDPCTAEFLLAIEREFNSQIKVMQLRLIEKASLYPMHSDNDMIIANICIENDSNIADHLFEFVRTELVGWIGLYQQEGMDTPIFHSITNKSSSITIICDNKYAFECLERCVEDIVQTKTIGSLKILPLPPITQLVYCFDAKYEGIASDPELFLLQLQLHKPKLYSDNWVVASHEVFADESKTYFIFLIDERSSLALNFQYSQSFYVCMQKVTFRNRGIVRQTI